MLKSLTGLFVYGTYMACLFGVGLPLLPFAIGAHVAMFMMPSAEVEELQEKVKELEKKVNV